MAQMSVEQFASELGMLPTVLLEQLKAAGVKFVSEADEKTKGPASFIAVDPDGNPVLVDQHI